MEFAAQGVRSCSFVCGVHATRFRSGIRYLSDRRSLIPWVAD